jgi:hypothetical protein
LTIHYGVAGNRASSSFEIIELSIYQCFPVGWRCFPESGCACFRRGVSPIDQLSGICNVKERDDRFVLALQVKDLFLKRFSIGLGHRIFAIPLASIAEATFLASASISA